MFYLYIVDNITGSLCIFQVDLIDMTMKPSSEYKYILHLIDDFSKFHMVSPLQTKSAIEVNSAVTKMFGTIGLPHTLQTDKGSEFARLGDIISGKFMST